MLSMRIIPSFTIRFKRTRQIRKRGGEHIYRQLRNAEPPDEETARGIIDKLFFSETRYNLGEVGRYRLNKKLELEIEADVQCTDQGRYYSHHQILD